VQVRRIIRALPTPDHDITMTATPRQWLYGLVLATVAFKLWLSAVFPVTGDEAYFIYWGVAPALGYYDHPPMVGWLLAGLLHLSDAPWWLRLPVTILPAIISLLLYGALRRLPGNDAEGRAALAAIGFLLVPIQVWNIFITTDTPLVFWSFLSGLSFWFAVRSQGSVAMRWFALSGALLGLAFLSKYFAVLLGITYLAYMVVSPSGQRNWKGLLVAFLAAMPFVAVNLAWNYENCWANLMFNLYNRHDDAGLSWKTPLLYAVTVLYVLSPMALLGLVRDRAWLGRFRSEPSLRLLVMLGGFPFLLFAMLSLVKQIGLHWVLSFVPFFFAACALLFDRKALKRSAMVLGVFSAVHIGAIAVSAALPMESWKSSKLYDGIVFHFHIADILEQIKPFEGEYVIAADGYSAAVTASYYRGRVMKGGAAGGDEKAGRDPYVFVFGEASSHARHDDLVTDFRRLQGRNILVLRKSPPQDADYRPYFSSVEYREFEIAGARFHLVLGRGFDYERYRSAVLDKVRARYYAMPRYLPVGHCVFCERYSDGKSCPIR
jgi:hypothetical protein